jgi:hypothetical protein
MQEPSAIFDNNGCTAGAGAGGSFTAGTASCALAKVLKDSAAIVVIVMNDRVIVLNGYATDFELASLGMHQM